MAAIENLMQASRKVENFFLTKELSNLFAIKDDVESLYMHAEIYDMAYRGNKGDIDFYKKMAKKGSVLYLGVGTGRIFSKLININGNIIGIDRSKTMTDMVKKKFPKVSRSNLIIGDVFSVEFGKERFDTIIAPFSFLTQFDVQKSTKLLGRIRNWLKKDGIFITDFFSPYKNPVNSDIEIIEKRIEKILIKNFYFYDNKKRTLDEFTLIRKNKKTYLVELNLHIFYPEQIKEMSKKSKFRKCQIFSGYNKEQFSKQNELLVAYFVK